MVNKTTKEVHFIKPKLEFMQHFGVCKKRALGTPMPLPGLLNDKYRQAVRIMKITAFILLVCTLHVSAGGYSQSITLSEKEAPLSKVFKAIEKQTDYIFFYNVDWVSKTDKVNVEVKDMQLQQVLDLLFKNQPLSYSITGKMITVFPKNNNKPYLNDKSEPTPPIDIHGRVVDENSKPVPGVTVTVKGTKKQTLTNENGEFAISDVSDNAVLTFSSVNMEAFEIDVSGQKEVLAKLKAKTSQLDEVQVVAYGQTTKRFQTGNVTTVKGEDIQKQPVSNPLLALEGQVPGLFISQTNGLSGGGVTVRIQGQNSIQSGNDPFYVIDGVPYYSQLPSNRIDNILGGSGSVAYGTSAAGNPLNYINPADIESIEVLKDADATAIYGSRAANGAILITTKKGKAGTTKVDINAQTGWGKVARKIEMLNTQQYLEMRKEAFKNDGLPVPTHDNSATSDYDLTIWDSTKYTDWQKELIGQTSRYSNITADVSGGTSAVQYLIGATYHKETTVFPLPDNFADKKAAVHFNLNTTSVNQKFKLQLSANYMSDNNKLPNTDLTTYAVKMEPNAPSLYNADGTLNWAPNAAGTSTLINPLSVLYTTYSNNTKNLIGNLNIGYKIIEGLDVRCAFGYNSLMTEEFKPYPKIAVRPERRETTDRLAVYGNKNLSSWIIEPQLEYQKALLGGKIDLLMGSTILENNSKGGFTYGRGYNSDEVLEDMMAASDFSVGTFFKNQYKYNAVFGRLNYIWQERLILNLTARRDGSSRFGSDNQFHNFGAMGAAWIFSSENFVKRNLNVLSFGKLRASYGTTGNDQIADYSFLSLYDQVYTDVAYQDVTGLQPTGLPNTHLQWEETRKLQLGMDLGFLHDRLLMQATYSRNRSSNQLLGYSLPTITGFTDVIKNFPATVQNLSWEFSLNSVNVKNRRFNWTTNFNLTIPKNKLIDFPGLATSSYANSLIIGQPINIHRLYSSLAVNQTSGLYQVDDGKGNATTTYPPSSARLATISTFPKYYGGIQNTVSYKGFSLGFLFQFVKQFGINSFFDNGSEAPGQFYLGSSNQPTTVLARWQKPGDNTNIQMYSTTLSTGLVHASDASYSDASFIRLKNVSLSWQVPAQWGKVLKIQNSRIYMQGQNLLTFTKYKGLDPETQNLDVLPPLKVLTVGLQVGF